MKRFYGLFLLMILSAPFLFTQSAQAQYQNLFQTARALDSGKQAGGLGLSVDDGFDFYDLWGRFRLGVMDRLECSGNLDFLIGKYPGDTEFGFGLGVKALYQLLRDEKNIPFDLGALVGLDADIYPSDNVDAQYIDFDLLLLISKVLPVQNNLKIEPYLGMGLDILHGRFPGGNDTGAQFTLPFGVQTHFSDELSLYLELRYFSDSDVSGDDVLMLGFFVNYAI